MTTTLIFRIQIGNLQLALKKSAKIASPKHLSSFSFTLYGNMAMALVILVGGVLLGLLNAGDLKKDPCDIPAILVGEP